MALLKAISFSVKDSLKIMKVHRLFFRVCFSGQACKGGRGVSKQALAPVFIRARCFKSLRKIEEPHYLQVSCMVVF